MKIVIYGATEIGCLLATEFFEDHDITIIDKEENRTDEFNKLDISFVLGNASNIDVLKNADIKNADVFIACTGIDEANIVACLAAKKYGGVRTICFVSKEYRKTLNFEKVRTVSATFLLTILFGRKGCFLGNFPYLTVLTLWMLKTLPTEEQDFWNTKFSPTFP
ncbi:MAG: NAD-binding protein [Candidatus Gastranaerophilaceae bacterium]